LRGGAVMKRLRSRQRALPLRLWLVVAVVAITGSGFLTQLGMTAFVTFWEQQASDARLTAIRQTLGTNAATWQNPGWQRATAASLANMEVDAAVFPAQSTQPAFATSGARQLLDTSQQSPANSVAVQSRNVANPGAPVFQRIVLTAPTQDGSGVRQVGTAFLWFNGPPTDAPWQLLWIVTELGAFALTLAIVLWLIGQPVIRPLIEMGHAAESIAGGNLNVRLARSPVHEIAEVSAALEGMTVTLRESLARQEALENERRLFIGAVAHDLRTPLFMLRGYLKGLQRGVAATPDKAAHYLAMCQAKADELERLVADLFAFTRLEYLELEPERQPMELGAVMQHVVEGAQPLAAAKDITLTLDAPSVPANLLGDANLLARAVENLVDNAIRYTPQGGSVCVHGQVENGKFVLSVADSGPGIATHDLAHVFKPLYRGEDSRNRQTGGAGLGLATARRIFVAHGGSLSAANRPEGGAIFTGTLPMPRRTLPLPAQVAAPDSPGA
ncbi:MAG TPA: HAMP domain-containing sensor histidine kinase, partial [Ktedonobacterales bacterium]|nr:HAMP domain-containing sensor histidine kinase [Ktedonobacterales bacterium]